MKDNYYTDESENATEKNSLNFQTASNDSSSDEALLKAGHSLKLETLTTSKELQATSVHKIWCLFKLETLTSSTGSNTQMDFIVVIDHSSSMRMDEKLAHVKASIQYLIERLNENHRFCLIEFNHEVNVITEGLLVMNEENKKLILEGLAQIRPEGSTNISGALFTAIDILNQRNAQEGSRISSIMLFTDGLANAGLRGTNFTEELAIREIPPGLVINTFGYGVDHDSKTLQNISFTSHGGVYYYIENTRSIGATFGECLGGILSTVAHNIHVRMTGEDGCRIVSYFTKYPVNEHKSVKDYTVSLGSLYSQETRSVLFKLSLRKLKESLPKHKLIRIQMEYTNTLTGKLQQLDTWITVSRPLQCDPQPMPVELDRHINRYAAALALEEAALKAHTEDFSGAQKHIQNIIEQIQQSLSAKDPSASEYCQDLVSDLEECAKGMKDRNAFTSGIHYAHAFSTMYYLERSTGTSNLTGVESFIKDEKKRNLGYGYKTSEQEIGASMAVQETRNYLSDYLF